MDRLKDRLQYAYERAEIEARKKGKKYKKYYDQEARTSLLMPSDRVLVQKKGVQGKLKIGDIWENSPYIVKKQPMPDIPVYLVRKENSNKKPRLLHRNMLLPSNGLPRSKDEDLDHQSQNQEQVPTPEITESTYSDSSSDSSSEDDYGQPQEAQLKPKKYIIPARRG